MSDRVLQLALRAYPRAMREREGEVVLDLARDLVDAGAPAWREAAGLAAVMLVAALRVPEAADAALLTGPLALAGVVVLAGLVRRRRDPVAGAVAALTLLMVAPAAIWLSAGALPVLGGVAAPAHLAAAGAVCAGAAVWLAVGLRPSAP